METLSRELGYSRSMVSVVAHGYQVPSAKFAAAIEARCGIAVAFWPQRQRGSSIWAKSREAGLSAEDFALDVDTAEVRSFADGEDVRPVPFAPGYFLTESGRLIRASKRRGLKIVKQWLGRRSNGKPQRTAILKVFGVPQIAIRSSRLVCLVFNGSPPDDVRVWALHRDDDSGNDHFTNLYWGTPKENSEDALRNEGRNDGLTNARAQRAIVASQSGATVAEIARRFNVSETAILNLLSGRTWLHLRGERRVNVYESRQSQIIELGRQGVPAREIAARFCIRTQTVHETLSRARRQGQLPGGTRKPKLTAQDADNIRALVADGCTHREVAEKFGVSQSHVTCIVNGMHWRADTAA
jgi:transposase